MEAPQLNTTMTTAVVALEAPLSQVALAFPNRYANLILAHDLLITVFPGKLFVLPAANEGMNQLRFDATSAHCRTTRNLLTKEVVAGTVVPSSRTFAEYQAQCDDGDCVHVNASEHPLDRVLMELEGENLWKCTSCPRTTSCTHRIDPEWFRDDFDSSRGATWTPPSVTFPVQSSLQDEVRTRRGFQTLSQLDPHSFEPVQLAFNLCSCGHAYDENDRRFDCRGTVMTLSFDGFFHGFLRTSHTSFFDLDLVNLVRLSSIVGAAPMSATYRIIEGMYASQNQALCSRAHFIRSCWVILRAVNVDLVKSFTCPHCGSLDSAPIIIGDGGTTHGRVFHDTVLRSTTDNSSDMQTRENSCFTTADRERTKGITLPTPCVLQPKLGFD
ncbi:hypothetical protein H257_13606 [Aphanomyces astaci]|uniref:HMG domain-containing protein n=1 Tax=Aphanomyces astaci TaxID=112090 RepID=W4FUR4_APHAT|nr:hypothetical protein H257_13606 [Aphanomyces astaci]ETV71232.1 hypothetical protein H257_13606 [Aphanomyces astaci]|eukprot:XP_009839478.1 hypothetical protein H257_13606 [Aphanomyces astaci]